MLAEFVDDTKRVFVSYVRENSDEIDGICAEFNKYNIEYWLDRDRINPGKFWKDAIKTAINSGAYFLACFSREYENRSETTAVRLRFSKQQLTN